LHGGDVLSLVDEDVRIGDLRVLVGVGGMVAAQQIGGGDQLGDITEVDEDRVLLPVSGNRPEHLQQLVQQGDVRH
jgi:hypothetical protein